MPHTLPNKDREHSPAKKPNYLLRSTGAVFACVAGFLGGNLAFGYSGKELMKEAAKPGAYVSVATMAKLNDFFISYGRSDQSGQRLKSLAQEALKARDFTAFDKFVAAGADGMSIDSDADPYPMQCRAGHVGHAVSDGNIDGLKHLATKYPDTFNGCASIILGEMNTSRDNQPSDVAAFLHDRGVKPAAGRNSSKFRPN